MKALRTILIALALTSSGLHCVPEQPPAKPGTLEYTESARLAYERAMRAFYDRSWEEAEKLFSKVISEFSQSPHARWSELRLADIKFEQDEMAEAAGAYKLYVQSHRRDAGISYAEYRICKALFLQINDTLILPPQEERDQSTTEEAYGALKKFREDYGPTQWQPDVDYMFANVVGRLVRHELYVARFYLKKDNFGAAVGRIQYALRNYEDSGLEPEAIVLLGETYLKMKKKKEAGEAFRRVLEQYPGHPFSKPASAFLAKMAETERPNP